MLTDSALGETLLTAFQGQSVDDDLRTLLADGLVGGVILFERNIRDSDQLRQLTADLRAAAGRPILISTDHEGGPVNRLKQVLAPRPPASALGARARRGDLAAVREAGARAAADLAAFGINLNFAPVVDVRSTWRNPVLTRRAFGRDPRLVSACGAAYLDGLQASGQVLGCLKHFPGLGGISRDPHATLPVLHRSLRTLERLDLAPYHAILARTDVSMIMVSHVLVPALDPAVPATFSRPIIQGLLRGTLGYTGVVITDSLHMGAISTIYPLDQACVLAMQGGCDLLLGPQSPAEACLAHAALRTALASGKLDSAQVEASLERIRVLKQRLPPT